jgi:hypothetical protein
VASLVAIAVVAAGLVYAVVPSVRTAVNARITSIKNFFFPAYDPVYPISYSESSHKDGHKGVLAFDQYSNTYWLARWSTAHEPTLTANFSHPVTLNYMTLTSGTGSTNSYLAYDRPSTLQLVFSNGKSETLTLTDSHAPQKLGISNATGVTSILIRVTNVYPSGKHPDVAISDIEFFTLKP